MTPRSIRRAAEHKARKLAFKAAKQQLQAETVRPIDPQPASPISEAQLAANRANALLSTGPKSFEGKATVSQNRISHGLTGKFKFNLLGWEDPEQLQQLVTSVYNEQKPTSGSERRLVESMIQHFWLMQRAITLQDQCLESETIGTPDEKRLGLYLRYQTTHERAYYKAMRELQNIRKETRKTEIGFESQKRTQEVHIRQQEKHEMKKEHHQIDIAISNMRHSREYMLARAPEIDNLKREMAAQAA